MPDYSGSRVAFWPDLPTLVERARNRLHGLVGRAWREGEHACATFCPERRLRMFAIALVAAGLPLMSSAFALPVSAHGLDTAPRTWYVTVGAQTPSGTVSGMIFTPSHIWVKQGDTIVWTAGSQEIQPVAFGTPPADTDDETAEPPLPPVINAFEEFEEAALPPAGGHTFTGSGFYNSGVMTTVPAASGFATAVQHYSLQIGAVAGTYSLYCLVHGPMMSQLVTVIPNGEAYPYTQSQYDAQAATERAKVFAEGFRAYDTTEGIVGSNTVYAGSAVDAGMADVNRGSVPPAKEVGSNYQLLSVLLT